MEPNRHVVLHFQVMRWWWAYH